MLKLYPAFSSLDPDIRLSDIFGTIKAFCRILTVHVPNADSYIPGSSSATLACFGLKLHLGLAKYSDCSI